MSAYDDLANWFNFDIDEEVKTIYVTSISASSDWGLGAPFKTPFAIGVLRAINNRVYEYVTFKGTEYDISWSPSVISEIKKLAAEAETSSQGEVFRSLPLLDQQKWLRKNGVPKGILLEEIHKLVAKCPFDGFQPFSNLANRDLTKQVFAWGDLSYSVFSNSVFPKRGFTRMNLKGTLWENVNMPRCFASVDVSYSVFKNISWESAYLESVNFTKASLESVNFQGSVGSGSYFDGATLHEVNFNKATLGTTSFIGTVFSSCKIRSANFDGSNFTGANLKDVDFHHTMLEDALFVDATLENVDFETNNLVKANFSRVSMKEVYLDTPWFGGCKGIALSDTDEVMFVNGVEIYLRSSVTHKFQSMGKELVCQRFNKALHSYKRGLPTPGFDFSNWDDEDDYS